MWMLDLYVLKFRSIFLFPFDVVDKCVIEWMEYKNVMFKQLNGGIYRYLLYGNWDMCLIKRAQTPNGALSSHGILKSQNIKIEC